MRSFVNRDYIFSIADIAYGATVTIRHVNTQGGYLHSHNSVYPGGSKRN